MPNTLEGEYDAAWKAKLRDRIMKTLDEKLQESTEAYQRKIADNASAPMEVLYRFQHEYNREVLNLQTTADEEVKNEIAREELERRWSIDQQPWLKNPDPTQALIEEQLAILNHIKTRSPDAYRTAREEYIHEYTSTNSSAVSSRVASPEPHRSFTLGYASTEATSISVTSSPDPYQPRHMDIYSSPSSPTSYYPNPYPPVPLQRAVSFADPQAQLRPSKHDQQQEEFRRRAEAILQRKHKLKSTERSSPPIPAPEPISSSSSTTSYSEEGPAPAEAVSKAENPMSASDVRNLMTFHDQQWTWMLTLPHIKWVDFPWPLLSFSSPTRVEDLTVEGVAEYIFAPLTIHRDRNMVKNRLKSLIRRWDTDRFELKYLARIVDLQERDMVRDGAATVARILNDLLVRWNELQ
ncbi:hypothetical protein BDN70DRAFT_327103 [Pholiota conissans]|uniref:Uncharacterized protein n=1 Tax=Pholiota conissans TaxID=109636 RepID=A0A9P5ZAI6_9AGAR|nr:hypothetical protein BDN70DRAFT_327103 [Pholiota conissans]